jgi:hypothetical protein
LVTNCACDLASDWAACRCGCVFGTHEPPLRWKEPCKSLEACYHWLGKPVSAVLGRVGIWVRRFLEGYP